MAVTHTFDRRTRVPAPMSAVWARVVTPEGINDEMMPWMSMSVPRGAAGITIDTVKLGQPVGKAWLRLFGLIPFDYDDLCITDLTPGEYFHEQSTMLAFRRWEHQRRLTSVEGETEVHDLLTFETRLPLPGVGGLLAVVLRAFFWHRHRRLVRHFRRGLESPTPAGS